MVLGIIGCVAWIVPAIGLAVSITGLVKANKLAAEFPGQGAGAKTLNIVGICLSAVCFLMYAMS